MARTEPQVNFRMPSELKARLEKVAGQNKRSITAELVARLESTFQESSAKPRRSIGVPGVGLQDANELESQETPEAEALRRCVQEIQRQREELHETVTQALTPLMEQMREDIHCYLEQANQRMADITAEHRPLDEPKTAHPAAASASKARTTGLRPSNK